MNVQTMRHKRINILLLMYFLMARQARDICNAPNNLLIVSYMEVHLQVPISTFGVWLLGWLLLSTFLFSES